MSFDHPILRFAVSGTLLGLYGLAEMAARRSGARQDRPGIPPPRWLKPGSWAAVTAFYLAIEPAGGALAGGYANALGIALALGAMVLRYVVRDGLADVRHPATAARQLFYASLPLAVGVPLGWLLLTAPALLMSAYCSVREDRILCERLGEPYRARVAATARWIPRVW